MSSYEVRQLPKEEFPPLLAEIPQPPKQLWVVGKLPPHNLPLLAVVGSRKYTTYGAQVVNKLITDLSSYNVGIVSGLAIGIDGLAHEAALKAKLYTLAVPGSGLDKSALYPARHRGLADKIIAAGGGLMSELTPEAKAADWTFPARNRIMAGMCQVTILIEAGEKSGTLITARMAVDYNRELLAVPGSIFSNNSFGTHQFLKLGATLVSSAEDIVEVLNLQKKVGETSSRPPANLPASTLKVLNHLHEPCDKDTLIRHLNLSINEANILLMQLELEGHISLAGGLYTALTPLPKSALPDTLFDRINKN